MLTFITMFLRLLLALGLGALLGIERELVKKEEAGIRTEMLVAGGACLFTLIALIVPSIISVDTGNLSDIVAGNSGFIQIIANIVVGIGFIGAGVIIHNDGHPRGLTTAAMIWTTSAIGVLVGLGLAGFASMVAATIFVLLYVLRKINVSR
jgi:putative Mg2+ transporter-C (MgtC) family protein